MSPSPCFASLFVKRGCRSYRSLSWKLSGNDHHHIGAQSIHFACFLFSLKTSTREMLMEMLTTLHGVPTYFSDFLTYLADENGVLTFKFWECFFSCPLPFCHFALIPVADDSENAKLAIFLDQRRCGAQRKCACPFYTSLFLSKCRKP